MFDMFETPQPSSKTQTSLVPTSDLPVLDGPEIEETGRGYTFDDYRDDFGLVEEDDPYFLAMTSSQPQPDDGYVR